MADELSWQETCEHFSESLSGMPFENESCISLKSVTLLTLYTYTLLQNKEITSNTVTEFSMRYLYNVKKSDSQTFW